MKNFLLPKLNRKYLVRVFLVAFFAWLVFGYLLLPLRIQGRSMEPTYRDGSFAFCWRLQYLFTEPRRYDVVAVRFAGRKVMLLKRIVALPGETVAFRNGVLQVNGSPLAEPYLRYPSDWELEEREVKEGYVYIIGDNRATAMQGHRFGQVRISRIVGGVLP